MTKTNPTRVAHCRCGAVELGAWAGPIIVATCYCDDCQAAAQRLVDSTNTAPPVTADGGSEFMVFRRDRIACTRGAENLEAMRLTAASKTRRMIAGCCTTPMYVAFDDKKPWVSAVRASFGAGAPPVECGSARGSDGRMTRPMTACPAIPAIRPR